MRPAAISLCQVFTVFLRVASEITHSCLWTCSVQIQTNVRAFDIISNTMLNFMSSFLSGPVLVCFPTAEFLEMKLQDWRLHPLNTLCHAARFPSRMLFHLWFPREWPLLPFSEEHCYEVKQELSTLEPQAGGLWVWGQPGNIARQFLKQNNQIKTTKLNPSCAGWKYTP